MSDLISRQAAIEAVAEFLYYTSNFDGMRQGFDLSDWKWKMEGVLSDLPSAQPEQRWISVSERLPEAEDCPMNCLVARKSKYIGNYTDMAVCEKNGIWTHEDWDAIVLGDVEDGKSTGLISTRDDNIIAWMPLPEPYREERTEE